MDDEEDPRKSRARRVVVETMGSGMPRDDRSLLKLLCLIQYYIIYNIYI